MITYTWAWGYVDLRHNQNATVFQIIFITVNFQIKVIINYRDFPGGSDKVICLQCRRPGFDPWVRKIPWRREWQTTPVFLSGKCHGQRSLPGYSPRGRKESDMTEWLGDGCRWDGWMASPTWWTWVWVNSGSWWWTGRPGMLWFMGLQRVGHDWATELSD